MNLDTLNELIEMPKKAEASKAKKKLYVEQMGILLSEESFSSTSIKYLKSGFSFAGAKPIAIYLQKIQEDRKDSELEKLLTCEIFRSGDKVTAFRFGVSLSAYSIEWFGKDQRILISLIKVLPSVSRNKEKQLLKDAPKIFEKYFLDVVADATQLPAIDVTQLKEFHIREYRQMMSEILNKVSAAYLEQASRIATWIGGIELLDSKVAPTPISAAVDAGKKDIDVVCGDSSAISSTLNCTQESDVTRLHSEKEAKNDVKRSADKSDKAIDALSRKELLEVATLFDDFSERLRATISKWTSMQDELETAKSKLLKMTGEVQMSNAQLDNEKKRNEHLTAELSDRLMVINNLQAQILEAKATIAGLEKQSGELSAENVRLNSIISVYSSDKQSSQSEQLNAIASKLKSEYRDFKDVENEEMTMDLGENFRFQLQSIFKILAKAGIDVERR